MTNDITALEEALNHCEAVKNTLAKSATTTTVTPGPPIFTAIEKAGVAEFKKERKSQHRVGEKHKRIAKKGRNAKVNQEPLLRSATIGVGRPKLKRQRRKSLSFPRQAPSTDKLHAFRCHFYPTLVRECATAVTRWIRKVSTSSQ